MLSHFLWAAEKGSLEENGEYVGAGQHGRERAKVGRQRLGENRLDGKEEMNPHRNSRET